MDADDDHSSVGSYGPPDGSVAGAQAFDRAFERLPVEQRALLVAHHLEGSSLTDIADELGIPVGTVKSRLHTARAALERSLAHLSAADRERVVTAATAAQAVRPAGTRWNIFSGPIEAALVVALVVGVTILGSIPSGPAAPTGGSIPVVGSASAPPPASAAPPPEGIRVLTPAELPSPLPHRLDSEGHLRSSSFLTDVPFASLLERSVATVPANVPESALLAGRPRLQARDGAPCRGAAIARSRAGYFRQEPRS